jgi:hypothetical protein
MMNIRNLLGIAAAGVLAAHCASQPSFAADPCFFKGTMFSNGAASCQSGTQFRCDDGEWISAGGACTDKRVQLSKNCTFEGISYSTGAASCQTGTQFRCEDGSWRTLGVPCSAGDSPVKIYPDGRTCMFDGATVSSNSTICRSGSTYVCSNGEWINLGTLCR